MSSQYKELLEDERGVQARIEELAAEIIERYKEASPLFVCLLKGGAPFASMLMFAIARSDPAFHPQCEYMLTRTYGDDRMAGKTETVMDLKESIGLSGRTVILLDDVLDTGETADAVAEHLKARGAGTVELIVLAQKDRPRQAWPEATLHGFKTPNVWLTGMGMDDSRIAPEGNRWLPIIATSE